MTVSFTSPPMKSNKKTHRGGASSVMTIHKMIKCHPEPCAALVIHMWNPKLQTQLRPDEQNHC